MSQILLICNPISGYSDKQWLDQLCLQLAQRGHSCERYNTQGQGDATRYIANRSWQADIIIVAGGDGTINEVAAGLLAAQRFDTPILPLSSGTANVLARELGLNGLAKTSRINAIIQRLEQGALRPLNLALLNNKAMLLMAGVGFDAWVVHNIDAKLKQRLGKWAYVIGLCKELSQARQRRYRLTIDGKSQQVNAAIISNGRLYAGPYTLCHEGDLGSRSLTVTSISANRAQILLALLALPLGLMHKCPGVSQQVATTVDISAEATGEPIQLDGDDFGTLPCHIRSSEHRLWFIHNGEK